jgi:glycosyltransferase involved in cell wall biosynthesis
LRRIGFAPHLFGQGWLGGLSYFRNLFSALRALESPGIEPVLLTRAGEHTAAEELRPHVATIRIPDLLQPPSGRPARAVARAAPLSRMLWRGFLAWHRIAALSHSPPLPARLPSLGFIYDFQHLRLPELFSDADRRDRDEAFLSLCRSSSLVAVSSENALSDLKAFFPACASKARVLRFVANVDATSATPADVLRRKYQLPDSFIYLPNQFWKHKNHATVIQALGILKRRGTQALVVCSGASMDYRHPEHFTRLTEMVTAMDLHQSFRVLGVVPYNDLLGLVRSCTAVLNPSLFEGWSTTVEEAKSSGKLVILSSIPVHLEQKPERSLYFDALSADQLADQLASAMQSYSPAAERQWMDKARCELPERVRRFALAYQELALDTIAHSR